MLLHEQINLLSYKLGKFIFYWNHSMCTRDLLVPGLRRAGMNSVTFIGTYTNLRGAVPEPSPPEYEYQ